MSVGFDFYKANTDKFGNPIYCNKEHYTDDGIMYENNLFLLYRFHKSMDMFLDIIPADTINYYFICG